MKNIMKKTLSILLITTMFIITGCSQSSKKEESSSSAPQTSNEVVDGSKADNDENNYPVTIKTFDYERNHIELPFDKAPEKVVTISLNSVENMIALGLEDKIVMAMNVNADRILPKYKEAFNKIKSTSKEFLSKEDVVALQPDFILGWYSSFEDKRLGDVKFWHDRGTKTYMAYNSACCKDEDYEYVTNDYIEREYLDILNLGKIFNVEERAEALVEEMKAKVIKGQEYAKKSEPKKVVILEDEGDVFRIYGEDTIGGQIATEVGAELVAKTRKEKKSIEDLIGLNPDIIFGVHFGPQSTSLNDKNCLDVFKTNPALQNINAYKTGKLIPTDLTMVYSPGVRLLESFDFFIENLYPDLAK